ncbi:hypothetical protein [uncultured Phenylobacterium sp.]|uniref:hypothetical protein n=1 Tax=uncultured Phenylobacterium sp. TaxID=349273 RepID=UPI0025D3FBB7|nr:hypothetical protein [uncultured Phenylobacterium sp.]
MSRYRAQVREVVNRNTVVSLALSQGFNAFLPVYDGGIDFILQHEGDGRLRKVQLKSRWTIDRKYLGRDIWIAFPISSDWYLVPHDEMVALAEASGATQTASWVANGIYNMPRPSKIVIAASAKYRLDPIEDVAAAAAGDEQIQ